MANVDNLNFKVIIDDKQFNQKIKAMEDMAKKFNTSMSNLLNVQAVSQQLVVSNRKRLQMETDLVRATEMQNREKIKTEGLQRKINAQIERASKGYQSQSRILQELKGYALGYLSIHGASQLLSSLVRVTGEFELQKTTLSAMLRDLNQAELVITRIQGLAVESPFQFKELTTYAKQLSAFSVPAQELYDTTKMLADISAGLGVGMDRIVLAYGQVRSAAFLRGQEVRQFTEAGIPILDELAKQFSELEGRAVSTGEVFDKISARLVPFEMVAKVFKDMTSEGGKFYEMQEIQAETLRGKISNLKDAYEVMLNEIGKGQSEKLKGAVDWARRLMQNYEETGRTLVELVAAYGIYRTTLFLTSNHITTLTRAHAVLMKQMRNLTKLLIKNKYAALAVAAIGLINKLYKLGKEIKSQSAIFETLSKSQSEYAKNVAESTVALDALYAKINLAKKGTKDYNTALSTIQRTYAPYIEQLRSEGVEVDNLATLYGELTKKINESAQARFVESARKDLDQTYAQELSDLLNGTGATARHNLKRVMESLNFNEAEGVVLRMFLSGSATWDEISEKYGELAEKVEGAYISLGAGSSGPVKAKDYLDGLKNTIAYLTNEYTAAIAIVDEFAIKMKKTPDPVVLATGWRKTVQDTLTGMGLNKGTSFGLWAEDTTQSTEYVDDMIKRYKELGEQIKNISSFDPDQTERLKKNKDAIEAIAKALNIDIKNLAANDSDTWESKEEKRLKRLIETLRKLQDQYDELKSLGVSEEAIKSLFKGWYPELGGDFFNNMDFLSRANTAVEELRKYNPVAADQALVNLGGDKYNQYVDKLKEQQKAYKESAKAAGEYFNMLRKWNTEDFNLTGTGVTFDLDKIASDLSEKLNEIDLRARKAKEIFGQIDIDSEEEVAAVKKLFVKEFGADAWDEFWKSYNEKGEKAISDLTDKAKEYEKKKAQERATQLAEAYVKNSTNDLNMTDWGDKSLSQIRAIQNALAKLLDEDLDIDDGVKKRLEELGISLEDFEKAVKSAFTSDYNETITEKIKKIQDKAKNVITLISEIGSAISSLGESIGSDALVDIGKYLSVTEEVVMAIAECDALWDSIADGAKKVTDAASEVGSEVGKIASSSDWITMIVKVVLIAVEQIANAIGASKAAQDALNMSALEYSRIMNEINQKQADTIFGENFRETLLTNQKQVQDTLKNLKSQYLEIAGNIYSVNDSDRPKLASLHELSNYLGYGWYGFDFGSGEDSLFENTSILDGSFLKMMQELKLRRQELENATKGTAGFKLDSRTKKELDQVLEYYDAYEKALEELHKSVQEMFGSLADDIASNMIDAFVRTGDAAADLGNVFESLGEKFLNTLVSSWVLDNILSKYEGEAMAIIDKMSESGNEEEIGNRLAEFTAKISDDLNAGGDFINKIMQQFQDSGLLRTSEGGTESLADGIKGITEDTANLLASYLNAIRADVSYARTIWERMDVTIQQLATVLVGFSAPNLMEYQAQIAANTYNTAMHTQSIMEDLRSMMTSEGGYTALRVYS